MKQDIVCISGTPGAGTSLLEAALAATGRLHNFGEIFQTENLFQPGSFFGYCQERRILFSDAVTPRFVSDLCEDYIEHLRSLAGDRYVLIDVDFNSWGVIRPARRYLQAEPAFLQFLKKLNALIILVRRNDILEQVVSGHLARAHHRVPGDAAQGAIPKVEIGIAKAALEARFIRQSESFFRSRLKKYGRRLDFVYEELFIDGRLSAVACDAVARQLGEPLHFPAEPPIRDSQSEGPARVRNYDELRQALLRATAKFERRKD